MVTYKVSKSYYNNGWSNPKCQARYGCWAHKVRTVKVTTLINCACCGTTGHKETYYMCDDHVSDLKKYLPKITQIDLRFEQLNDPIMNNLFIKPKS